MTIIFFMCMGAYADPPGNSYHQATEFVMTLVSPDVLTMVTLSVLNTGMGFIGLLGLRECG